MNEKLVLKYIKPHLNIHNEITYDEFNEIFSILEQKEQYEIVKYLFDSGIYLVDKKISNEPCEQDIFDDKEEDKKEEKNKKATNYRPIHQESNEFIVAKYQGSKYSYFLDVLIEKNRKFIIKTANRIASIYVQDFDEEDIFNIACEGFIKGCQKFDCKSSNKLLTYVAFWIKQHVAREIINTGTPIRIPVHMWDRIKKIRRLMSDFPNLSHEELAKKAELSLDKFEDAYELMKSRIKTDYLDRTLNNTESVTLLDSISQDKNYSSITPIEKALEQKLTEEELQNALQCLSPRERDVLRLRFGLNDNRQRTLQEIGDLFGVTRERIRQVEKKGFKRLRNHIKRNHLLENIFDSICTPEENRYAGCFKKNGASYIPTIDDVIKAVLELNPEMDIEDLYEECVLCAELNGYGEFESMNYFVQKLKKIRTREKNEV